MDATEASRQASRALKRKERREAREEERDERATGRERLLEKRKERNEERRTYEKDREEQGMELDEATLMGSSNDSFRAACVGFSLRHFPPPSTTLTTVSIPRVPCSIAARDRARERKLTRKLGDREEREAVAHAARSRWQSKEAETMAAFKAMAQQRFG